MKVAEAARFSDGMDSFDRGAKRATDRVFPSRFGRMIESYGIASAINSYSILFVVALAGVRLPAQEFGVVSLLSASLVPMSFGASILLNLAIDPSSAEFGRRSSRKYLISTLPILFSAGFAACVAVGIISRVNGQLKQALESNLTLAAGGTLLFAAALRSLFGFFAQQLLGANAELRAATASIAGALGTGVGAVGFFWRPNLFSFGAANLVGACVQIIFCWPFWRRLPSTTSSSKVDRRIVGAAFRFAAGVALFSQFDRIVVATMLSPVDIARYGLAIAIGSQVNSAASFYSQSAISRISPPLFDREREFGVVQARCAQVVMGALVFGVILHRFGLPALGRSEYRDTPFFGLVLMFCAYGLYSVHSPAYYLLLRAGRLAYVARTQVFAAVVTLATITAFCKVWGLTGALVGNLGFALVAIRSAEVGKGFGQSKVRSVLRSYIPLLRLRGASTGRDENK